MQRLPPEIRALVLKRIASDSTHSLKPFTLVSRLWRSYASPLLLETISVTSLGDLVQLCDYILDSRSTGDPSSFERYTTTIVLSGHVYFGTLMHPDLEGMERYYKTDEDSTKPDTTLPDGEIDAKVEATVSRFQNFDSLEWYGRFAGDELLVGRLRREGRIRSLILGTDVYLSQEGFAYSPNAFSFEKLVNLTFMTRNKPARGLIQRFIEIAQSSPQLERIAFQGDENEDSVPEAWFILDLIRDQSQLGSPLKVWPNLKYLELHYISGEFWTSAVDTQTFTQFLLSHDQLECLVLKAQSWQGVERSFSLAAYSGALPNLRRLHGSLGFICGVCESPSACSSLQYIFNSYGEHISDSRLYNRFISAFSQIPRSSLKKLRISTPGIGPEVFGELARIASDLEFLELMPPPGRFERDEDEEIIIPTGELNPLNYLPAALAQFPRLRIIGHEPAAEFILPFRSGPGAWREEEKSWVLQLAKAIPQIEAILVRQGHMLEILRDGAGNPSLQVGDITLLDHLDYDWLAYHADWVHRPVSREEERLRYKDNMNTPEEFCKLLAR